MKFRDSMAVSGGNLTRMKLRTFLTITGVVIAIATFVAMLSFGAGNQKYIEEQFDKLGLLNTMQVYPQTTQAAKDSIPARPLDRAALEQLSHIPGVRLAYPFDAFSVTATFADSQLTSKAQALSKEAINTKFFSNFRAGGAFANDSANEAVLSMEFLRRIGMLAPDSAIGKPLVLTVRIPSVDSGLAKVFPPDREYIKKRIQEIKVDSLLDRDYTQRLIRTELNNAMQLFLKGYLQSPSIVSETLMVTGVLPAAGPQERSMAAIIVPEATGRRLSAGLFGGDPTELVAALSTGQLLSAAGNADGRTFPHVTLDLDPRVLIKPVADSVKALGFKSFSFAEQFEELKRMFFYFNLALGVIGVIALITASLGIINTMVMSVLERRREIGVLKSLGADERDIRFLFLVEAAAIGLTGSVLGILCGWVATRIISRVAQVFMVRGGIPGIELFAMPIWLIGEALLLGLVVSIAAGYYPASRAARIDPVEALRNE